MNGPVDRVENAALRYDKPEKVRRAAESAKEKDQPFTQVLREKMEEEQREKRKQKSQDDQVVLHSTSDEPDEVDGVDDNPEIDTEEASEAGQLETTDHVDLKA